MRNKCVKRIFEPSWKFFTPGVYEVSHSQTGQEEDRRATGKNKSLHWKTYKLSFIYKELLQEEPTQAVFALMLHVQCFIQRVWMVQTHDCCLSCRGFAGEEATCHWPEQKREMKHRLDKPRRLYEPHKLTETSKTPLEVSQHKGDVALSTAHFSPEDPRGEGLDGRDVRTWPLSGSGALTEKRGQQTWAEPPMPTGPKASFQVSVIRLREEQLGFTHYLLSVRKIQKWEFLLVWCWTQTDLHYLQDGWVPLGKKSTILQKVNKKTKIKSQKLSEY